MFHHLFSGFVFYFPEKSWVRRPEKQKASDEGTRKQMNIDSQIFFLLMLDFSLWLSLGSCGLTNWYLLKSLWQSTVQNETLVSRKIRNFLQLYLHLQILLVFNLYDLLFHLLGILLILGIGVTCALVTRLDHCVKKKIVIERSYGRWNNEPERYCCSLA